MSAERDQLPDTHPSTKKEVEVLLDHLRELADEDGDIPGSELIYLRAAGRARRIIEDLAMIEELHRQSLQPI